MKYLAGFIFGLLVASAAGQDFHMRDAAGWVESIGAIRSGGLTILQTGQKPDGKASVIKVDSEGRVICSTESGK